MRLITFGDSNTYGQALPDCYWDKPGLIGPSKFAWPQLLADKLGMECHNAGIPGSSNKLIMHQLMSFPLLPTDTVVVLWSFPERYCHLTNLVTDYIGLYKDEIEHDMNTSLKLMKENSDKKQGTRKKRQELSLSATRGLKMNHYDIEIRFD